MLGFLGMQTHFDTNMHTDTNMPLNEVSMYSEKAS